MLNGLSMQDANQDSLLLPRSGRSNNMEGRHFRFAGLKLTLHHLRTSLHFTFWHILFS